MMEGRGFDLPTNMAAVQEALAGYEHQVIALGTIKGTVAEWIEMAEGGNSDGDIRYLVIDCDEDGSAIWVPVAEAVTA